MIKQCVIAVLLCMSMGLCAMDCDKNDFLEGTKALLKLRKPLPKKHAPFTMPGFTYGKSVTSSGIVYTERPANGKKSLVAKKFTSGPLKGQTLCVIITIQAPALVETVGLDDAEVHYERLKRIYDRSHN